MEESGPDLVLSHEADTRISPVAAYTLGYVRDLSHSRSIDIGVGNQFTINNRPTLSIATTDAISATSSSEQ